MDAWPLAELGPLSHSGTSFVSLWRSDCFRTHWPTLLPVFALQSDSQRDQVAYCLRLLPFRELINF